MSNLLLAANAASAPAPKATTPAPAQQTPPAPKTTTTVEQPAPGPNNANEPPKPPSPWMSLLPFILIFVVMIFFMNRSQKKQMAKRQEMMNKITKGTAVLLASGVYGKVAEVREDSFLVEIADNVKIRVNKSGIAAIDEPEAAKNEGK